MSEKVPRSSNAPPSRATASFPTNPTCSFPRRHRKGVRVATPFEMHLCTNIGGALLSEGIATFEVLEIVGGSRGNTARVRTCNPSVYALIAGSRFRHYKNEGVGSYRLRMSRAARVSVHTHAATCKVSLGCWFAVLGRGRFRLSPRSRVIMHDIAYSLQLFSSRVAAAGEEKWIFFNFRIIKITLVFRSNDRT